ncbi:MAG: DoxX family protein [Rikenellaceae bacterium]
MKTLNIAQLYLRITIGGLLLLSNISKFQNYNISLGEYHPLERLSAQFWFILFAAVESATALMLIIGLKVRLAAATLAIGTILYMTIYFPSTSKVEMELHTTYIFIYIYILISGGGLYAYDTLLQRAKPKPQSIETE